MKSHTASAGLHQPKRWEVVPRETEVSHVEDDDQHFNFPHAFFIVADHSGGEPPPLSVEMLRPALFLVVYRLIAGSTAMTVVYQSKSVCISIH